MHSLHNEHTECVHCIHPSVSLNLTVGWALITFNTNITQVDATSKLYYV